MNEVNRNTRTLIMSFIIAVMVLIPLRFVEVGQMVVGSSDSQVLGETVVLQEKAEPTVAQEPILEEPYNTIDSISDCFKRTSVDAAWAELKTEVENGQVGQDQVSEATARLVTMEQNICK